MWVGVGGLLDLRAGLGNNEEFPFPLGGRHRNEVGRRQGVGVQAAGRRGGRTGCPAARKEMREGMSNTPEKSPPAGDLRWALNMGLAIGVGLPLARSLKLGQALGLGTGFWGTVGTVLVNGLVAGLVGAAVGLVVYGLLRRVGRRAA